MAPRKAREFNITNFGFAPLPDLWMGFLEYPLSSNSSRWRETSSAPPEQDEQCEWD